MLDFLAQKLYLCSNLMWERGVFALLELSPAEGQVKAVFVFHDVGWIESRCQVFLVKRT